MSVTDCNRYFCTGTDEEHTRPPRWQLCGLGSADMSTAMIDPDFLDLPLQPLAAAALERAQDLGAAHADVRIERVNPQMLRLRGGADVTARVEYILRMSVDGSGGEPWGV